MRHLQTPQPLTPELVRSRGSKLFFETIPEMQPSIAEGFRLVAVVSEKNHLEAREVSLAADYVALIAQSKAVGAYFEVEGLYTLSTNLRLQAA